MKKNDGFSLVELIIVVAIIGLLAALAIPNLLASRMAANEGSAISSLRLLHAANVSFSATYGNGNFAGLAGTAGTSSLTELNNVELLDSSLATGGKAGYAFIGDRTAASPASAATFYFAANPQSVSGLTKSGSKRFGVATDGVQKADEDEANLALPFDTASLAAADILNH